MVVVAMAMMGAGWGAALVHAHSQRGQAKRLQGQHTGAGVSSRLVGYRPWALPLHAAEPQQLMEQSRTSAVAALAADECVQLPRRGCRCSNAQGCQCGCVALFCVLRHRVLLF
jgi:hypothetical protein